MKATLSLLSGLLCLLLFSPQLIAQDAHIGEFPPR